MTFVYMSPSPRNLKVALVTLSFSLILSLVYFFHGEDILSRTSFLPGPAPPKDAPTIHSENSGPMMLDVAQYFIDFPLRRPYKSVFGELGRRARILGDWIIQLEGQTEPNADEAALIEQVAVSLFPFLANSPQNPNTTTPLSDLRRSFVPGSAGIVIPTGDRNVRFAGHLVAALRSVLKSVLPITIVYAGDADLSAINRYVLATAAGTSLEFVDITTVFDDSTLKFTDNAMAGWATKSFAALGSHYEKVIVLDADAVFLQPPEAALLQPSFSRTGAFLFHDRLLWQHRFQDRHDWWKDQIRRPSATLNKSRVWTEDYAEECDSGVVLLDKGRVDVLMGLLHTCWQNSFEVRDEITYKITYGDKETWWMGLEMAGSEYAMGRHYGGIVGWEDDGKVCSFVIAHVDEGDRLLWYNGGLLRNKLVNQTEYMVPTSWMYDGNWIKGEAKVDISCMANGTMSRLTAEEREVLERSVEKARWVDGLFGIE